MFVNKKKIFHHAGGDIPRQTRDRRIHVSIGRFAMFAHVVFFRGPNSQRVTRVNDRRYTVGSKPGV